MVGDGERWKQGVFTDFALVSDGQRWPAMIQVVLQVRRHFGVLNVPVSIDILLPWSSGLPPSAELLEGFLCRPAFEVARDLLGYRLVSTIGGRLTSGVIVETEAYDGPADPASHAATVSGLTKRNAVMFGPAGFSYVYRIYGMHWCMNVVTGREGDAGAVLLRGLHAMEGQAVMKQRRGREPLSTGPGRLCQALGITGDLYGHDLRAEPLQLRAGWAVRRDLVGVSTRIGVSAAPDWRYRFYVLGATGVSRHPGDTRRPSTGPEG